jgi:hypothetical protein
LEYQPCQLNKTTFREISLLPSSISGTHGWGFGSSVTSDPHDGDRGGSRNVVLFNQPQLIAREGFINFRRCRSFISCVTWLILRWPLSTVCSKFYIPGVSTVRSTPETSGI